MILLLPNQLFSEEVLSEDEVTLVEHSKFFTDKKFHKQKLVLHKASIKLLEAK